MTLEGLIDQWLTRAGSLGSVIGLILVLMTYLKVRNIKKVVPKFHLKSQMDELYSEIRGIPSSKRTPTKEQQNYILEYIRYVEMFYLSKFSFLDRKERELINKIRTELKENRNLSNIKRDVNLIKNHIFYEG